MNLDGVKWISVDQDRWQLCIPKCANWKIKIYINYVISYIGGGRNVGKRTRL